MPEAKRGKIRVLMFPWLAHGHIYPFVELAKKLTRKDFYFYICSSPVNISSIKSALSEKHLDSIEFVELHLPSLPELPPHMHSTKSLPNHLQPLLVKALDMSSPNFLQILENLRPDLLIYDVWQPWAPTLASSLSIPAINLCIFGAALTSASIHPSKKPREEFPFPEIYASAYMIKKLAAAKTEKTSSTDSGNQFPFNECVEASGDILLINSFRELEGKYIDHLSSLLNKKVIPVGPLVQDPPETDESPEVMEWLDDKDPASVLLVSFGSEYFLNKEEREVIAQGLELSGVNFIWVLRFPQGEVITLEEALPEGFPKRARDKGLFIEGWSPQAKILAHSSTGAFLSHCGWNSVNESIKFGVPIIAIPMHLEQPVTARVVDAAGVGVEITANEDGNYVAEEIAKKIERVMVDQSGEAVKKKAKEFKEIIENRGVEATDDLAKELQRLCGVTL